MALFHMNFFSEVLGMGVGADVILPQKGGSRSADDKYPVLYLLHGLSDDHTVWQRKTSIERYAEGRNLAIVMPTTHRAWYTDSPAGRYFTYIACELPRIMHEFFPQLHTDREHTYIAGLSMGGYGAYKIALTYPQCYSHAASLSGALDVVRLNLPGEKALFFGNKIEGGKNDVFALAKDAARSGHPLPRLFQWCGTRDSFCDDNRRFLAHIQVFGYDIESTFTEGSHSWADWDREIQNVLDWIRYESHL